MECGVASGASIRTAMPTTIGVTGSLERITNWVNDGWTDIQMDHDDWDWMRSSVLLGGGVTFATVAGKASYPLGTIAGTVGVDVDSFGKWDRPTVRCYPTATGYISEMYLTEVPFDVWRDDYMLGARRNVQTRPTVFAVGPDQSLCLGPPPNALYTITADYFVSASEMVSDIDVPIGLPVRFHMLPVYRAMMKYARYESAAEVYARAEEENAGMYAQLEALRAPRITFCGALA